MTETSQLLKKGGGESSTSIYKDHDCSRLKKELPRGSGLFCLFKTSSGFSVSWEYSVVAFSYLITTRLQALIRHLSLRLGTCIIYDI